MENKLNDLIRLAEGKMTLERFRHLHNIFEPLTDEEYLAIVNRNYLYEPIQDGKSYERIRVDENGNKTGVPNETREQRKAIDYANSVTIDFFEIGKLQRQLQKEVRTASLISKVDEIEQQIEALWVKLFGNNKPSICSVIPRSLLINIYDNFSDYLDYYNDSNHFADEVLCDNPIRVKEGIKKWIQHLITVLLQKLNDASLKNIPQTKIYITLFPTRKKVRGRSLNIEEEKQKKSYQKNKTLIDKIEDYLNLFDAKKYIT